VFDSISTEIPTEETLVGAGKQLIEGMNSWNQGKTYHKVVKTYDTTTSREGPKGRETLHWHGRISEHTPDQGTFDQFWEYLGKNKAVNEKEYTVLF
jgi:hypothetical protein